MPNGADPDQLASISKRKCGSGRISEQVRFNYITVLTQCIRTNRPEQTADPDQTSLDAASDRGLQCLLLIQKYAYSQVVFVCLFVLRFYGPINPMGSCRARSVYLTTRLLGRFSLLSG